MLTPMVWVILIDVWVSCWIWKKRLKLLAKYCDEIYVKTTGIVSKSGGGRGGETSILRWRHRNLMLLLKVHIMPKLSIC